MKNNRNINSYIEHTLLKADTKEEQIKKLCEEAIKYNFACVCVLPCWATYSRSLLKNTSVRLCSVVGFPLGSNQTKIKTAEAEDLIQLGVEEIDMVLNIGYLKEKKYKQAQLDIESVLMTKPPILKVIIETCLLNEEEKKEACKIVIDSGAHFVKTSTGFSHAGATIDDVRLIKNIVGSNLGIKASGGISDYAFARELIGAGATRLGTSKGTEIFLQSNPPLKLSN